MDELPTKGRKISLKENWERRQERLQNNYLYTLHGECFKGNIS